MRLLEKVGLDYQPDLVILAYVLNDPFLQNGVFRRVGNSFFMFQAFAIAAYLLDKIGIDWLNSMFVLLHQGYAFDLVVRNSFERLRLLSRLNGFSVAVAVVPLMTDFEHHAFTGVYEKVASVAREQGFDSLIFFDEFKKHSLRELEKETIDMTHPNAAGHVIMSGMLEDYVRKDLRRREMAL